MDVPADANGNEGRDLKQLTGEGLALGGCSVASPCNAGRAIACENDYSHKLRLHYRFYWLGGAYRVCVPMHYLPGTLFGSKDHRNPQIEWLDILPSACLCLAMLYPHDVGKLGGHVLF